MDPNERPAAFDPDLDVPRRSRPPDFLESITDYQRLVCNPFLGVFAMVVVYGLIRMGLELTDVRLFLAGAGSLIVPFFVFQYHCLDCGATGWLLRYRRHACPAVVARCNAGRTRRFHGLDVKIQAITWMGLMAIAIALAMVAMPFSIARR